MSSLLHGLNQPQQDAVAAGPGPILVLAGPGSGKTRVLTNRIVYLIQEAGLAPWHILAVTFTNKAAKEMLHRIEKMLDGRPNGLLMGTFHSTCARILRREAENLTQYSRDFVIFDTDDQKQVIKKALADLNLDEKRFTPGKMLAGIGAAKNEMITPELYAATNYVSEVIKRVYTQYQALLRANNAMDFDDLLMNVVLLWDERPDILHKYQQQYQYVLVDEFQDTNTTQYALLQRLAAAHRNIFVVGDADQSIYKWRGADIRNIQRFREQYPDAQMILLEQNYRSTQLILDAAKAVIRQDKTRIDKDLFTERSGGAKIQISEAYNDTEEAEMVVGTIQEMLLRGYAPGDFAVMYRTNAQSRALEEAFLRRNLPYRLVGALRFYGRKEVKDVIAYLRLVNNLADSISFARIINVPTRGIGDKTQQELRLWGEKQGWQPGEALIHLATERDIQHPFNGRSLNALLPFAHKLAEWAALREQISVGELLDKMLSDVNYRGYIDDDTDEGRDRWANVNELRNVAAADPSLSLTQFLEQVALVADVDNLEESTSAPTMLTLHAAKGLEFPIVFITGLEEGILPHSRSIEDGDLDEERRLFYVGITRAKDRLYLYYAFRRSSFGESEANNPSRFLNDIPDELTNGGNSSLRRKQTVANATTWNWTSNTQSAYGSRPTTTPKSYNWAESAGRTNSQRPAANRPQSTASSQPPAANRPRPLPTPHDDDYDEPERPSRAIARFKSGQKVRHAKFGEGMVIESKLTGSDEEVSVAFPGQGIKKLAASFAKLELVE